MAEQSFSDVVQTLFAECIGELGPADRVTAGELDAAEEDFGSKIPQPLREYYLLTGRCGFNQVFNRFLLPSDIWTFGGGAVFCEENQCVVHYGFRISDADQADPQIWQLNPHDEKWYPDCKRMTSGILNLVCWQAVCGGVEASASGDISMDQFEELASEFEFVNFGEGDHGEDLKGYQKNGVIFCAFPKDGVCPVYFGSNREDDIRRIADQLGLDFL